jgi:hypothetical protein
MSASTRAAFAVLGALGLSACLGALDPLDPEVGAPLAERCVDEDSDPSTEVSFARDVAPIFRGEAGPVGCGCHIPTKPAPIGFEETGLDLSSYAGVRAGGRRSAGTAVVPGQPCASLLVQKISPAPPFGARMPFYGPPFLEAAARQRIADWVAEGARDD